MICALIKPLLIVAVLALLWSCSRHSEIDDQAAFFAQTTIKTPPTIVLVRQADRDILQRLIDDMVAVPAGSYQMGDALGIGDDVELPIHRVTVHRFALSRFEVTFEQYDLYARIVDIDAPADRWGRGKRPVIDVSWHDAMDFIAWLRQVTQRPFRLPTEAEWEYAMRAGTVTRFSFGNDSDVICQYANIADSSTTIGWRSKRCSDGYETTAPVGSFKPNAFGLYDMSGNVWEWLADCWYSNYRGAPDDASLRNKSSDCEDRVQRGGSWFYGPEEARSSFRSYGNELDKSVTLGFRLAQDL